MWKRVWLVVGLASAACKGEAKDRAPAPAMPPARDEPRADAAGQPLDIPTVDVAAGAPLPRQPGGILVIDEAGRIAAADASPQWDGELPAQTTPLSEPDLERMWLYDRGGGSGTRLALAANRLTPAAWRAARKRRARQHAIPMDEGRPARMVRAVAAARAGPDDEGPAGPAIFASPAAPARLLAKVLVLRGGTLVVRTGATPGALAGELAMYAGPGAPPGRPWIELHLEDGGVHVLLIPTQRSLFESRPFARAFIAWHELDRASLGAALAEHAAATGSPPELDLVVGDGVPVQRFVEAIAYAHALGVRAFGVAERVATPDQRHVQSIGRDWIKRTVRQHREEIKYCYERRLEDRPDLAGTVQSRFHVLPDGRPVSVDATGLDADVADCVALVLEGMRFPPFDEPAGILMSYPFTFRLAGAAADP